MVLHPTSSAVNKLGFELTGNGRAIKIIMHCTTAKKAASRSPYDATSHADGPQVLCSGLPFTDRSTSLRTADAKSHAAEPHSGISEAGPGVGGLGNG